MRGHSPWARRINGNDYSGMPRSIWSLPASHLKGGNIRGLRLRIVCKARRFVARSEIGKNLCYTTYNSYDVGRGSMRRTRPVVISMRLPAESGSRLKRMANRHGWTPSDTSARLVEEGLRRSEFAYIDFRDSAAGRQAYMQGSTLAVWEVLLLVQSYKADVPAVARHLKWPEAKVQAAVNYANAFREEIETALSENVATDFEALKRMLPQATEFISTRSAKGRDAQASSG